MRILIYYSAGTGAPPRRPRRAHHLGLGEQTAEGDETEGLVVNGLLRRQGHYAGVMGASLSRKVASGVGPLAAL